MVAWYKYTLSSGPSNFPFLMDTDVPAAGPCLPYSLSSLFLVSVSQLGTPQMTRCVITV